MTDIEIFHFDIVEIDSQVWFMNGEKKCIGFKIASFLIIPVFHTGFPFISEVPLPEVFMQ
jgi:hypothetical protein